MGEPSIFEGGVDTAVTVGHLFACGQDSKLGYVKVCRATCLIEVCLLCERHKLCTNLRVSFIRFQLRFRLRFRAKDYTGCTFARKHTGKGHSLALWTAQQLRYTIQHAVEILRHGSFYRIPSVVVRQALKWINDSVKYRCGFDIKECDAMRALARCAAAAAPASRAS